MNIKYTILQLFQTSLWGLWYTLQPAAIVTLIRMNPMMFGKYDNVNHFDQINPISNMHQLQCNYKRITMHSTG